MLTSNFKNLSLNGEKICFTLGKIKFWPHYEFSTHHRNFNLRKGPEYLYRIFDVLPKQTACEMKTLQVLFYIQRWFHDEQRAKYI